MKQKAAWSLACREPHAPWLDSSELFSLISVSNGQTHYPTLSASCLLASIVITLALSTSTGLRVCARPYSSAALRARGRESEQSMRLLTPMRR
jgi:hypothetical protein